MKRILRFLCFSILYFAIHNHYILKYFDYLTSMSFIKFSWAGLLIYLIYTKLVLNRYVVNGNENFFFYIFELIFFAPLITYISFSNRFGTYFLVMFGFSLLLYMMRVGSLTKHVRFTIPVKLLDIFAYATLFVALVFISRFELNLNPDRIYEVRDVAASRVTGIFRYILFWSANFSAPYLLMRNINRGYNLWVLSVIFIVAELFLFSVGNNKSFLFVILITLMFINLAYDTGSGKKMNFNPNIIPKWILRIFIASILILLFFPASYVLLSFVFFRTFSVAPRQLDLYYNFMNDMFAQPTYLSQSFPFSLFFEYPHSAPLGIVVSKQVLGVDNNSNAAFLFSDGIASFGVLLGPIIAFLLLNFFCSLLFQGFDRNRGIRTVLTLIFIFQILNTSILTSFITGAGFFIFLLSNTENRIKTSE